MLSKIANVNNSENCKYIHVGHCFVNNEYEMGNTIITYDCKYKTYQQCGHECFTASKEWPTN